MILSLLSRKMDSRRARVRKAMGKSVLTRSNGSRHLINDYNRTQNSYNNLMSPNLNAGIKNGGIGRSSRFLRTLRSPYNAYKESANINFLTRGVARRARRYTRRSALRK
jgi:hypothetical protein